MNNAQAYLSLSDPCLLLATRDLGASALGDRRVALDRDWNRDLPSDAIDFLGVASKELERWSLTGMLARSSYRLGLRLQVVKSWSNSGKKFCATTFPKITDFVSLESRGFG